MTREKGIIYMARVVSMIFTPFYLPLVGLALLLFVSYFRLLPLSYRLQLLVIVYFFTILLPTYLIHLYRRHQGWTLKELGQKERRMVPYVISILCYFACVWSMQRQMIPRFMCSIVIAALMVQMVCAVINVWWKISTHTAAIGGVAGALFCFAEYFGFNPVWWFMLVFVIAGVLGSSRMILRQHTLGQVVGGFFVGLVSALAAILFI